MTKIIGVLSGTSMDGISVGLFEFGEHTMPTTLATMTKPLPTTYKQDLLDIINAGTCSLETFGQTDHMVGTLFAEAVLEFMAQKNIDPKTITAIGSHGQTLWHAPLAPKPFTLQIGDPNIIAAKTAITTVADFRRADLAIGGCGAPLAPAFHLAVFANANSNRCVVNVGGFSNISVLAANKYLGYDSGPGNCLMDYWVKTHFAMDYDAAGTLAASGQVNNALLQVMFADPYFSKPAPKSTGREYFNAQWLQTKLTTFNNKCTNLEVLTTLLHLTANSIATEIKQNAPPASTVFICGGGAHNLELRKQLGILLEQDIQTTATLGIDPDYVEAALFAWLAKERLNNSPIDLTKITGSKRPVILGGVFTS